MEELILLKQLSFWLFALLMIGGALGVVFHRSIVYSALLLLVAFLSIAAFYIMLNAPFLGAAQILVYAVGLTIVLIFGIMLTGDKPFKDPVGKERPRRFWLVPGIVASVFIGFLIWALLVPNLQLTASNGLFPAGSPLEARGLAGLEAIRSDGGAKLIGIMLFNKYLVPFELASVLLLLAMVGAIILSKKEFPEEEGEPLLEAAESAEDDQGAGVLTEDHVAYVSAEDKNRGYADESEREALGVR